MRQTLHWLPASDFSIYINALRTSRIAALMRIMSKFGITEDEMDDMNQVMVELLADAAVPQGDLIAQLEPKVGKRVRAWMKRSGVPAKPLRRCDLLRPGSGGRSRFPASRKLASQTEASSGRQGYTDPPARISARLRPRARPRFLRVVGNCDEGSQAGRGFVAP